MDAIEEKHGRRERERKFRERQEIVRHWLIVLVHHFTLNNLALRCKRSVEQVPDTLCQNLPGLNTVSCFPSGEHFARVHDRVMRETDMRLRLPVVFVVSCSTLSQHHEAAYEHKLATLIQAMFKRNMIKEKWRRLATFISKLLKARWRLCLQVMDEAGW